MPSNYPSSSFAFPGPATVAVSVIIPAYNMAEYIAESIDSVLASHFQDFEILVIDDGSTDHTRQVVNRYLDPESLDYDARISYHLQPNGGKPRAVNAALNLAKGKYITILDADDQLTPDSLSARMATCTMYPGNPDLVIGGFEVFDHQETIGTRSEPATDDASALKRLFFTSFKTPFHFSACLMARTLIEKVGPFDVCLKRCQDIDYSLRCLNHAQQIALANTIVYRYRKHRNSIRERIQIRLKTAQHRPRVFWKNFAGPGKIFIVLYGIGMDTAKMAYELTGNYKS